MPGIASAVSAFPHLHGECPSPPEEKLDTARVMFHGLGGIERRLGVLCLLEAAKHQIGEHRELERIHPVCIELTAMGG